MTVQRTLADLVLRLDEMLDSLGELHLTIEDRPRTGDVALVDMIDNRINDVAGWIAEARAAAAAPMHGSPREERSRVRSALVAIHELVNRVAKACATDPVWYGGVTELTNFGHRRGGEWQRWTDGVQEGLSRCSAHLLAIGDAADACWYELTEFAAIAPVSTETQSLAFAAVRREPSDEGG